MEIGMSHRADFVRKLCVCVCVVFIAKVMQTNELCAQAHWSVSVVVWFIELLSVKAIDIDCNMIDLDMVVYWSIIYSFSTLLYNFFFNNITSAGPVTYRSLMGKYKHEHPKN